MLRMALYIQLRSTFELRSAGVTNSVNGVSIRRGCC